MSTSENKNQSFLEEIEKNKSLTLQIDSELKRKKLDILSLEKKANELSLKIEGIKCENQLLTADIELSNATCSKLNYEISVNKKEIEETIVQILEIESKSKQCAMNNKLFEKSTGKLREQWSCISSE